MDTFVNIFVGICVDVVYYILLEFLVLLYIFKICSGVCLRKQGYDKWWLYLIPCGHLWVKRQLASLPTWRLVVTLLCTVFFLYTYLPWPFFVLIILTYWNNYTFASIYIDSTNPAAYTFIPFFKYYVLIRDSIAYQRSISGIPTDA